MTDRNQQDPTTDAVQHSTSDVYIGRWNRLVSTTNWEKGRIILDWRSHLVATDAPATEYSDDAWSRMVGNVSGQHVGRLRRVYERFGDVFEQYEGLFWSHFQSALDWDDAEMWLEGAIQNDWSVSTMRRQRWETMGAVSSEEPRAEDVVLADVDEDVAVDLDTNDKQSSVEKDLVADDYMAEARSPAGPDFGDEGADGTPRVAAPSDVDQNTDAVVDATPEPPPFAEVPELPDDLTEAFEAFQLAIIHHKTVEWKEVPREDVLATLDALKALTTAPA